MARRRRGKPLMTTAVTMSAMSNRKTNKMQQQQMQQEQQMQQQNYAAQQPAQSAATVQPDPVPVAKPVEQENQIRTIASAISLYRKKDLSFAEIFTKLEAYNKGFKNEADFKKSYLDFVNEEAITTAKWEKILEFELEHQE